MKSVFVINGFLDSGKTQFISYTLAQPYFRTKGTTLLIVCEEGEEEYDDKLLKATGTIKVVVEDQEEITPDKLVELDKKYKPARIIFEYNGMWNCKEFKLPFVWKLEQQITLINTETFDLYFNNMRSLFAEMVRKSELIIFNRADGRYDALPSYKRNVKTLNPKAEIIFEDKDGEVNATLEEELPYDVNASRIDLTDETFGAWYIDMMDNTGRYVDKEISFVASVLLPDRFPGGMFVAGRKIMTCCADDIQFMGFPCKYRESGKLKNKQWVKLVCTVKNEYFEGYQGEGPMLEAVSVESCKEPKNEVLSFS